MDVWITFMVDEYDYTFEIDRKLIRVELRNNYHYQ